MARPDDSTDASPETIPLTESERVGRETLNDLIRKPFAGPAKGADEDSAPPAS